MTTDQNDSFKGPVSFGAQINKDSISRLINEITKSKHEFHQPKKATSKRTLNLTKELYAMTKAQELPYRLISRNTVRSKAHGFGLDNLIISGFNNDQIWQQLELRNKPFFDKRAQPLLKELLGAQESPSEDDESNENQEQLSDLSADSEVENSAEEGSDPAEEESDAAVENFSQEEEEGKTEEDNSDEEVVEVGDDDVFSEEERTEVDDDFFSLNRMHKMVEKAEQEEMNSPEEKDTDEESIDLQMDPDELASDDDIPVDEMKFSDFFKGVSKGKRGSKASSHKVTFAPTSKTELFDGDSEEVSEGEKATKFERKQATMTKMIEQLEEENVSAKPWTMMGEAAAWNRPKDSLLEEDLEFDHASKPVPVVTVEVTQSLEQMIQQRILDQNFNNVVKPAKEKLKPRFNSDEVELDTEKAKQSLAQVYEDEYRKATSKTSQADEIPPEVQKAHQEIDTLFQSVCFKLDALANCHYAPKMPKIEVQVVQDLPAIAIEEKIPLAVSDATLLAPEEVFAQAHHGQAGKIETSNELSQEERNRLRNRKKRLAKARSKNSSAPKSSSEQS